MKFSMEYRFPDTNNLIRFEPEHRLIYSWSPPGHFDQTVLEREMEWSVLTMEDIVQKAPTKPLHLLIHAENLGERSSLPFKSAMSFFKFLHSDTIDRVALCCAPKELHRIVAPVRVLAEVRVEYFDTEEDARKWLAESASL